MRMIRWGCMLALVLAIAPMFALQVFAVGEGVGIGPPAASMSIQSAYETLDVPVSLDTGNGIMLSAPDGVSTQPNSGVENATGQAYRMIGESNTVALPLAYVRLWRHEHGANCGHTTQSMLAVSKGYLPESEGRAMALPGGIQMAV